MVDSEAKCQDFIKNLQITVMTDRQEEITEAERATFDWIFEDPGSNDKPWSNFSDWLRHGETLYWIAGKAGSGKSTLMKHLANSPRCITDLRLWAGDTPLVLASFFFWNSGSELQKSLKGLFRSLLYQCLKSHRELLPMVLPDMMDLQVDQSEDIWTLSRLRRAFTGLVRQDRVAIKLCLFIDGLDEYSGTDHDDIAELFKWVSEAPNVKVCVSSRPLGVFERAFHDHPRLMLQNLTFGDIKIYVKSKLSDNEKMLRFRSKEPELASKLALEIVTRASGVFLWVKLVVQSLLEGLNDDDDGSDLERRLQELPDDLERLYWHMLKSIKPAFCLKQAFKLLLLVHNAPHPLTLLQLSYADLEDTEKALKTDFMEISSDEQYRICARTEGRLKSRCRGLLEAPGSASNNSAITTKIVQFIHLSVADFLESTPVKAHMTECLRDQNFNPDISLMKGYILELKHLQTRYHRGQMWYTFAWSIIHNFTKNARRAESSTREANIALLDELDRIASYLWGLCAGPDGHYPMRENIHWSEAETPGQALRSHHRHATFLSYAMKQGLVYYVNARLSSGERKPNRSELKYMLQILEDREMLPSPEAVKIRQQLLKAYGFRMPLIVNRWLQLGAS